MLNLTIVTPVKKVLEESVDEIVVPTIAGEIAILTDHVDLLTAIKEGEMIIRKGGKDQHFAVTGGFLEVANNNVSILADYAVRAEDIEITKVKEAQERAKKIMAEKVSQKDIAMAEADLRRALLELNVAMKRKRSSPS